jgi:transposase
MDGTLCYPGTPTEHTSLVPVTPVATTNEDEADKNSVLWVLWCIVLSTLHNLRQQIIDLRAQANYWQAQHQRAVQREAELKEDKQHLQAQIRELQQRLFGRKSETSSSADPKRPTLTPPAGPRRRRGHQVGAPSQGRRNHDHLPIVEERCTLPEEQRCCPYCHEPYEEIPGSVDGSILEVEVRVYRRCYHRQRYRRH